MHLSLVNVQMSYSLWSNGKQPQSGQGLLLSEMQELCVDICGEDLHKDLRQEQQSNITDT